jgi:hypothetical protein
MDMMTEMAWQWTMVCMRNFIRMQTSFLAMPSCKKDNGVQAMSLDAAVGRKGLVAYLADEYQRTR